jgi:hypothetical protein
MRLVCNCRPSHLSVFNGTQSNASQNHFGRQCKLAVGLSSSMELLCRNDFWQSSPQIVMEPVFQQRSGSLHPPGTMFLLPPADLCLQLSRHSACEADSAPTWCDYQESLHKQGHHEMLVSWGFESSQMASLAPTSSQPRLLYSIPLSRRRPLQPELRLHRSAELIPVLRSSMSCKPGLSLIWLRARPLGSFAQETRLSSDLQLIDTGCDQGLPQGLWHSGPTFKGSSGP